MMVMAVFVLFVLPTAIYQAVVLGVLNRFARRLRSIDSEEFSGGEWPGVSVIVPVKGLFPGFEENFKSFLSQDYPGPLQLVLAVKDPASDLIPVARDIVQATQSRVEVVFATGGSDAGLNPKNSNLIRAFPKTVHPWIYCSDADVRLEPQHLRRFMKSTGGDPKAFASAVIFYEGAKNLGALLEGIGTNVEATGYFLINTLSSRCAVMNGAAMLFHRDLLAKAGGFEGVADTLTDDLLIGKRLFAAGGVGRIAPSLMRDRLESQPFDAFWDRLVRWILIVRCFEPKLFWMAPLSWVWQWMVVLAWVSGNDGFLGCAAFAFLWRLGMATLLQIRLSRPGHERELVRVMAPPLYDIFGPLAWFVALFTTEVRWAGQRLFVRRDGILEERSL